MTTLVSAQFARKNGALQPVPPRDAKLPRISESLSPGRRKTPCPIERVPYLGRLGWLHSAARKGIGLNTSLIEERLLPKCSDCRTTAPQTETAFTLIGPKFGWRLTFQDLDGERHQVWRCRECWNKHRGRPER